MKRGITIFFLILLLSTQTPAGQLFKLPILIEHFVKHQKQNGVSFIDFLKDHYKPDHNDGDLPEDQQLPFKNITFYSMAYAIVPGAIKTHAVIALMFDKKIVFADSYTPQQHLGSIFHPPRA